MSDSELEIVVDDPTAPDADSPALTDVRVVDIAVSLLLALVAATLGVIAFGLVLAGAVLTTTG